MDRSNKSESRLSKGLTRVAGFIIRFTVRFNVFAGVRRRLLVNLMLREPALAINAVRSKEESLTDMATKVEAQNLAKSVADSFANMRDIETVKILIEVYNKAASKNQAQAERLKEQILNFLQKKLLTATTAQASVSANTILDAATASTIANFIAKETTNKEELANKFAQLATKYLAEYLLDSKTNQDKISFLCKYIPRFAARFIVSSRGLESRASDKVTQALFAADEAVIASTLSVIDKIEGATEDLQQELLRLITTGDSSRLQVFYQHLPQGFLHKERSAVLLTKALTKDFAKFIALYTASPEFFNAMLNAVAKDSKQASILLAKSIETNNIDAIKFILDQFASFDYAALKRELGSVSVLEDLYTTLTKDKDASKAKKDGSQEQIVQVISALLAKSSKFAGDDFAHELEHLLNRTAREENSEVFLLILEQMDGAKKQAKLLEVLDKKIAGSFRKESFFNVLLNSLAEGGKQTAVANLLGKITVSSSADLVRLLLKETPEEQRSAAILKLLPQAFAVGNVRVAKYLLDETGVKVSAVQDREAVKNLINSAAIYGSAQELASIVYGLAKEEAAVVTMPQTRGKSLLVEIYKGITSPDDIVDYKTKLEGKLELLMDNLSVFTDGQAKAQELLALMINNADLTRAKKLLSHTEVTFAKSGTDSVEGLLATAMAQTVVSPELVNFLLQQEARLTDPLLVQRILTWALQNEQLVVAEKILQDGYKLTDTALASKLLAKAVDSGNLSTIKLILASADKFDVVAPLANADELYNKLLSLEGADKLRDEHNIVKLFAKNMNKIPAFASVVNRVTDAQLIAYANMLDAELAYSDCEAVIDNINVFVNAGFVFNNSELAMQVVKQAMAQGHAKVVPLILNNIKMSDKLLAMPKELDDILDEAVLVADSLVDNFAKAYQGKAKLPLLQAAVANAHRFVGGEAKLAKLWSAGLNAYDTGMLEFILANSQQSLNLSSMLAEVRESIYHNVNMDAQVDNIRLTVKVLNKTGTKLPDLGEFSTLEILSRVLSGIQPLTGTVEDKLIKPYIDTFAVLLDSKVLEGTDEVVARFIAGGKLSLDLLKLVFAKTTDFADNRVLASALAGAVALTKQAVYAAEGT